MLLEAQERARAAGMMPPPSGPPMSTYSPEVERLDETEAEAYVVACERAVTAVHARQSLAMDTLAGRVDERLQRERAERPREGNCMDRIIAPPRRPPRCASSPRRGDWPGPSSA